MIDRGVLLIVAGEKGIFLDFLLFLQSGPGTCTYIISFGSYTGDIILFVKLALLSSRFRVQET